MNNSEDINQKNFEEFIKNFNKIVITEKHTGAIIDEVGVVQCKYCTLWLNVREAFGPSKNICFSCAVQE